MNYIVYDLEATCWEHTPPGYVQETIEIGAFRINHFGEVRGKFNRFIRPSVHPTLSPFCRNLTSIQQEDVNRALAFPEVIQEFWDWGRIEEEDYILCSWGSFDKKMFANDCRLHRMDPAWTDHHVNLKEQYRNMKRIRRSIGLRKAVEKEGILFTGVHHRGISDAENLVKLFLKYLGSWDL
ncbi:MAG: exonuclease domain-containing protein [Saprospiraceae bacterium]|nr:exonuclease domain-containing protein [Saprospiraceae bacterium]MCB0541979.1 exonuclease domain-containing protein [Saprospiraceae bacterium]MCB0574722.1 exonuclease domain-containing protein [Saprospiraceae bacterium]MCB9306749.1 exonuclease domain-containing protein [Lewinellaceae bacterium]